MCFSFFFFDGSALGCWDAGTLGRWDAETLRGRWCPGMLLAAPLDAFGWGQAELPGRRFPSQSKSDRHRTMAAIGQLAGRRARHPRLHSEFCTGQGTAPLQRQRPVAATATATSVNHLTQRRGRAWPGAAARVACIPSRCNWRVSRFNRALDTRVFGSAGLCTPSVADARVLQSGFWPPSLAAVACCPLPAACCALVADYRNQNLHYTTFCNARSGPWVSAIFKLERNASGPRTVVFPVPPATRLAAFHNRRVCAPPSRPR